jgi:hypothetical protein
MPRRKSDVSAGSGPPVREGPVTPGTRTYELLQRLAGRVAAQLHERSEAAEGPQARRAPKPEHSPSIGQEETPTHE